MNRRMLCRMALMLALLILPISLCGSALAEEAGFDASSMEPVQAAPVEASVEEQDVELIPPGEDDRASGVGLIDPDTQAMDGEMAVEALPDESMTSPGEGEQAVLAGEIPGAFGSPLEPVEIRLSKNKSKTVYLGVPYRITLKKGKIKSVKSSAKKIARASKDGTISLYKSGKAKLTVKTSRGKRYTLTLKVVVSAPKKPEIVRTGSGFVLRWDAASHATAYLIQSSPDESSWTDIAATGADALSFDISPFLSGSVHFRIAAVLGDHIGGVSDTVSAFSPVKDLQVVCEESFLYGPTNRLNITWKASAGVSCYEVYRATLPSGDFQLIGTTAENWFPDTRPAKELCAYRVRPVCDGIELPMSAPVTLWSGMKENVLPPDDLTSSTGIILLVNKKAQVVTAYVQDAAGAYTIPLRHMICSTGRTYERTRNGTYQLQGKHGEWYTYPGPSGDTIRWPSVYRSGYYFHSPLYDRDHTIRSSTVRRLGKRASAGCVRLKSNDAEWVYKHCPNGTRVVIVDGKSIKALNEALKPRTVKVKGF